MIIRILKNNWKKEILKKIAHLSVKPLNPNITFLGDKMWLVAWKQ